jgi:hypothetical protein
MSRAGGAYVSIDDEAIEKPTSQHGKALRSINFKVEVEVLLQLCGEFRKSSWTYFEVHVHMKVWKPSAMIRSLPKSSLIMIGCLKLS